jgi:hypothetical protein
MSKAERCTSPAPTAIYRKISTVICVRFTSWHATLRETTGPTMRFLPAKVTFRWLHTQAGDSLTEGERPADDGSCSTAKEGIELLCCRPIG